MDNGWIVPTTRQSKHYSLMFSLKNDAIQSKFIMKSSHNVGKNKNADKKIKNYCTHQLKVQQQVLALRSSCFLALRTAYNEKDWDKTSKSNETINTIINRKLMISEVTFQVLLDATWVQSAKATCRDSRRQRRGKGTEQSSSSRWSSRSKVKSSSTFTSLPILSSSHF